MAKSLEAPCTMGLDLVELAQEKIFQIVEQEYLRKSEAALILNVDFEIFSRKFLCLFEGFEQTRRRTWERQEQELLFAVAQEYSNETSNTEVYWAKVALVYNLRSNQNEVLSVKKIREHWINTLNPNADKSPFTEEEDEELIESVEEIGKFWTTIAQRNGRRNANQIKNRYYELERYQKQGTVDSNYLARQTIASNHFKQRLSNLEPSLASLEAIQSTGETNRMTKMTATTTISCSTKESGDRMQKKVTEMLEDSGDFAVLDVDAEMTNLCAIDKQEEEEEVLELEVEQEEEEEEIKAGIQIKERLTDKSRAISMESYYSGEIASQQSIKSIEHDLPVKRNSETQTEYDPTFLKEIENNLSLEQYF